MLIYNWRISKPLLRYFIENHKFLVDHYSFFNMLVFEKYIKIVQPRKFTIKNEIPSNNKQDESFILWTV